MTTTYIGAATDWWEKIIRMNDLSKYNMGKGEMYESCANIALKTDSMIEIDEASMMCFVEKLAKAIEDEVQENGSITLKTEYEPKDILADVVFEAEIDEAKIPWMTKMIITPERVSVSLGFNEPEEIIFEKDK